MDPLTGGTGPGAKQMAATLLQYANRAKVAEALTEQGYPVTRMTVNRWARGGEMPGIAATMIAELFGHADTKKTAPLWAEPLLEDVAAIRRGVESEVVGLAALKAVLATIRSQLPPPDDDPPDGPAPAPTVAKQRQ